MTDPRLAEALARWRGRKTITVPARPPGGRPSRVPPEERLYREDGRRDWQAEARARYGRATAEERAETRARLYADGLKRCSACSEAKPLDAFSANASMRDGLEHRCRACRARR